MTDLLISVTITGIAVAYILEYFNEITGDFFGIHGLNMFVSIPLCFGGNYLLDTNLKYICVAMPASALIAAWVIKQVNKPVVIPRTRGMQQ
jgi:hypothetical protein